MNSDAIEIALRLLITEARLHISHDEKGGYTWYTEGPNREPWIVTVQSEKSYNLQYEILEQAGFWNDVSNRPDGTD